MCSKSYYIYVNTYYNYESILRIKVCHSSLSTYITVNKARIDQSPLIINNSSKYKLIVYQNENFSTKYIIPPKGVKPLACEYQNKPKEFLCQVVGRLNQVKLSCIYIYFIYIF